MEANQKNPHAEKADHQTSEEATMKRDEKGNVDWDLVPVVIAGTLEDQPEHERIRKGLIKVLKKFGGYEPAVDDLHIEQIATSAIYSKKTVHFLDSANATEITYSRIIDSKLKLQKMIETALHQLALNRRDRLGQNRELDLMRQLREAIQNAVKDERQGNR